MKKHPEFSHINKTICQKFKRAIDQLTDRPTVTKILAPHIHKCNP